MQNTLGIVLRTADYKDYDKMLTLFSREHGKLSLMAAGSKSMKNPLYACAQPLCCGVFSYQEKNGRYFLKQCEIKKKYYRLAEQYEAYLAASQIVALTEQALMDANALNELFVLTVNAIDALERQVVPEQAFYYFVLHLIDIFGLFPALDYCALCGSRVERAEYFSVEEGGVVCAECAPHVLTQKITPHTAAQMAELKNIRPIQFKGISSFCKQDLALMISYLEAMTGMLVKSL